MQSSTTLMYTRYVGIISEESIIVALHKKDVCSPSLHPLSEISSFISLSANFYRQKSKQIMLKVKTSQQLIEIISWLIYSKVKTDLLVIGPSGWDHWWRLHGSVWAAGAERQTPRQRDRRDVAGPVRAGQNVQDPTQTQRPAETQDRHTHRWVLTHKWKM